MIAKKQNIDALNYKARHTRKCLACGHVGIMPTHFQQFGPMVLAGILLLFWVLPGLIYI